LAQRVPEGSFKSVDFNNRSKSPDDLLRSAYIWARRFKSKSGTLHDFPAENSVKYLELNWANIRSFSGVSRIGKLKRLETHYCLKLESDSGLCEVASSLEWLHINQSRKFSPEKELFALCNLRVLCLNNCAPLHDLEFCICSLFCWISGLSIRMS
jgi:hypothetical protein